MANDGTSDLTSALRAKGVRKKLAEQIGKLEGNKRRSGAKGEERARQAVDDLTAAADDIRARVLTSDPKRRTAARTAAQTRERTAAKRRASAKRGATKRGATKRGATKRGATKRGATTRTKAARR